MQTTLVEYLRAVLAAKRAFFTVFVYKRGAMYTITNISRLIHYGYFIHITYISLCTVL